VKGLNICGHESYSGLMLWLVSNSYPVTIVERFLGRFQPSMIKNGCSTQELGNRSLTLGSGSLNFIASYVTIGSSSQGVQLIGVLDHHFHGRLRNGRPSGISLDAFNSWNSWSRIRHETVGGVTLFAALFCSTIEISPSVTTLRRTLNHVIDFGIRPECIQDTDCRKTRALTLKDRVYPNQLDQHVVYHTPFCCTGLGLRNLTPKELAHAYGLPLAARLGELSVDQFEHFVPAQLLHAVWECVTKGPIKQSSVSYSVNGQGDRIENSSSN
jgi:hypothetical protein